MKKHIWPVFSAVVVLLGLGVTACGGGEQRTFLYLEKARGLGDVIMKQAGADLNICKMYDTVWEYARVSDMDFETAQREMMGGRVEALFLEMDTNQEMLVRMLGLTENPPRNCRDIQIKLDGLYSRYKKFHRFIRKNPTLPQKQYKQKVQAFMDDLAELKEELDQVIVNASGNLGG
jgi:hypothetical protein